MRSIVLAVSLLATVPVCAARLHLPGGVSAEAMGPAGAVVTYSVSAEGDGSGDDHNGRPASAPATVTCSPASGATFPLGTTHVQCSATDSTGTTTGSFPVVVTDTTPPTLQLPGNFTLPASSSDGAIVTFSVNSADIVDGVRGASCTPGPGLFAPGTTLVTCSSSDAAGNETSGSFSITVTELQPPPEVSVPDDLTAEATSPAGASVTFSASARGTSGDDDENGRPMDGVSVSCAPASGSTFPLGATTVQCTATGSGGSTTDTFTVTVVDTTAPALDLPRSFTVQGTSNDGADVTYTASASDLVDGSVSVTCSPASGSTFPVGTTAVSCSASDAHGNAASGGFEVRVTAPDAPPPDPELNLPDDITVEATGPGGAIVTFEVTTNGAGNGDDHNGRPTSEGVTCAPSSGSLFALGSTTVQCSAGNASGSFLVHVVDTTAPTLTLPADITTTQQTVVFDATATDVVDGNVAVTCTPSSGSQFAFGTTTVNCSAADARANTTTGSFSVTVTQETPARTITVTATPASLWPPDHKMVAVTIDVTISDGSAITAQIVSVSSNENDPDDNTSPDWVITGPLTLELRAEKSSKGQGRTYTIEVEVIDDANVTHLEQVQVTVEEGLSKSSNATRLRTRKR